MAEDLVQPDMSQLPLVMDVLETALSSWEAVAEHVGRDVAGDPIKEMATALLLAGFKRVAL